MTDENNYVLNGVWVSHEMEEELVNKYGVASESKGWRSPRTIEAVQWDLELNKMFRFFNTIVTEEDDLARILILLPTVEARLEYLNNH